MYVIVKIDKYNLIAEREAQSGRRELVKYYAKKNDRILITYGPKSKYRVICMQGDIQRLILDCDDVVKRADTELHVTLGEGINPEEVKVIM